MPPVAGIFATESTKKASEEVLGRVVRRGIAVESQQKHCQRHDHRHGECQQVLAIGRIIGYIDSHDRYRRRRTDRKQLK